MRRVALQLDGAALVVDGDEDGAGIGAVVRADRVDNAKRALGCRHGSIVCAIEMRMERANWPPGPARLTSCFLRAWEQSSRGALPLPRPSDSLSLSSDGRNRRL